MKIFTFRYACIIFYFVITDPPGKPGKPRPTDWDRDHVDLEWAKPKSDGGADITKYIIEKKDKV